MKLPEYTAKVLDLGRTIHRWLGQLLDLEDERQKRIAQYCEQIADCLSRAGDGLQGMANEPSDRASLRTVHRELGRMRGYLDGMTEALDAHLDGRKLAGVRRRLETLVASEQELRAGANRIDEKRIGQLAEAEGYFRALADGLKV